MFLRWSPYNYRTTTAGGCVAADATIDVQWGRLLQRSERLSLAPGTLNHCLCPTKVMLGLHQPELSIQQPRLELEDLAARRLRSLQQRTLDRGLELVYVELRGLEA
eukprot:3973846-Prymnesium_polylepis.1